MYIYFSLGSLVNVKKRYKKYECVYMIMNVCICIKIGMYI